MCGRFTLRSSGEAAAKAFGLPEVPDLFPRFNIAPGQPVAVVWQQPRVEGRELATPSPTRRRPPLPVSTPRCGTDAVCLFYGRSRYNAPCRRRGEAMHE